MSVSVMVQITRGWFSFIMLSEDIRGVVGEKVIREAVKEVEVEGKSVRTAEYEFRNANNLLIQI